MGTTWQEVFDADALAEARTRTKDVLFATLAQAGYEGGIEREVEKMSAEACDDVRLACARVRAARRGFDENEIRCAEEDLAHYFR